MLETVAMILAGYAGYAGWPWWWAAVLGLIAGVWNANIRFFSGPQWSAILQGDGMSRVQRLMSLLFVSASVGTIAAVLFTGLWYLGRLFGR